MVLKSSFVTTSPLKTKQKKKGLVNWAYPAIFHRNVINLLFQITVLTVTYLNSQERILQCLIDICWHLLAIVHAILSSQQLVLRA